MPRRKPKRRQHKLIAFKAYFDEDAEILDWWESIENGDRSEALREVIRGFLGMQPRRRKSPVIDLPELLEVRQDTLWIRDALNDMPAYLERVIQHVAADAQPVTAYQEQPRASPVQIDEPSLTDAESQRRTQRMRNATW